MVQGWSSTTQKRPTARKDGNMRKVIEAEAIVQAVREAAERLVEHVNDHAAVPSLTMAEARELIRAEGWSPEAMGFDDGIDWQAVDFDDAAYEVGSEPLLDAAIAHDGAEHVVKYTLDAMDDEDRARVLAHHTKALEADDRDVYADAITMLKAYGAENCVRALLGMPDVTCEHIGAAVAEYTSAAQSRVVAALKGATKVPDLFPSLDREALKAELRAEVEQEVREALIAKLFGAAK